VVTTRTDGPAALLLKPLQLAACNSWRPPSRCSAIAALSEKKRLFGKVRLRIAELTIYY
jgi:hypothetical protein